EFELVKFENELLINSINSNDFKFYCNKDKSFDWVFYSEEKNWIIQSSDNIVAGKIRLGVFDNNNQTINKVSVHYKTKNSRVWNDYNMNMILPIGPLDIKITAGADEEYDTVFNIGNVDLKYHLDVTNPKLVIQNLGNLKSEIYDSQSYSTEINNNIIQFNLSDTTKLPSTVKIRFFIDNHARGVILRIKSPFQGVEIINSKNEINGNNILFADNLKGFRLIANTKDTEYEIVFYNNKNKELRITRSILKSSTSLQEFQSIYDKLFRLFNIVDKDNYLIIKINRINWNASVQNVKTYELKQFSKNLNWKVNEDSKIIFQNSEDVEFENLFVIPLDCNIDDINKIELLKTDDHYEIANEVAEKYIVFSNNTSDKKTKPEFISLDPNNISTDDNDRIARITNYKNQLLEEEIESEIWNKFLIYYYLCKENNLPFSTFDILKSITISSQLAAKAFFFLVYHLENSFNTEFSEYDFIIFQNDLGFSFNWVNKEDWQLILTEFGFEHRMVEALTRMLNAMSSIFILNEVGRDASFVLNPEFINLRSRLGQRVLSELPIYSLDFIPQDYRKKIADIGGNEKLILLASFPLLLALSITGKRDDLWHPLGESTRRKILYLMELDKQWYRQSLHYYLTLN
ncbi:hypothetical protein, partial [Empedobacter sp.]|uniref:hypothetical protein n=1 Tax=Empedobacter sp. TaxID=1927715 RepID=UPI00289BDE2C